MPQSRSQGWAPSAPRAGSPRCPCACGANAAPRPPPRRGHPRRLRSRRGGGWLVLGLWELGGDELAGVRVHVVEVVVVVVAVVGVVRRHLLDARGDAPHRLHIRLRGRPGPRPPPFDPPSPPGSHAPSCLFLGARGALALALGPLSGPLPVPRVPPPVPHTLARPLAHRPSPRSLHLGALPKPLRALSVPWSLPAPCPESRRPLPALWPPPLLRPCSLPRVPRPAPCARSCALPLSPPVARSALPWLARSSACTPFPPSWITRRASHCLCCCGSVTPGGERSGAGGRTCRARPGGKGLGGNGLRGLVWVWVGLVWARYFALSLPTAAAAAAAGEAPVARAGSFPRFRGVLGVAAWPAEAVARLAGAAVATPRAPSPLSSAAAAAPGNAPGSCAGATPCVGGVPGAAVGAAAWLPGAAVSATCTSGAPSRGGAAGLAAEAAGAVTWAGSCCWAGGGGPTSTAASASLRSSHSAGVSPVHSGETGERERDRRWWRSSRWREPSESAITVLLVGMHGGRRALPTTSWCISAVPWAVPCGALRGGGGEGVGGRLWRQPRMGGGRRPCIGIGRGDGGATRPTRRATAASLGRGPGPWAPGGRRVVLGGAALGGPP